MMSRYSIDRLISPPHKLGLMPRSLSVPPGQTDGPDGLMGEKREGGRRASRPTDRPTGEAAELELVILPPLRTAGSARARRIQASARMKHFFYIVSKNPSWPACLDATWEGWKETTACLHL